MYRRWNSFRGSCEARKRMARRADGRRNRACRAALPRRRLAPARSDANDANTALPDPVIRACRECLRNSARAAPISGYRAQRHRLQIVPAITLGKDVHFRRRRVACQFRRRENRRGRRRSSRGRDHRDPHAAAPSPAEGSRRCRARTRARRKGRRERPRRARRRSPSVRARGSSKLPHPIEREQHRGGIGAAAAQSARPPGSASSRSMSTPARHPVAALSACAARTARSASSGDVLPAAGAPNRAVVARASAIVSPKSSATNSDLQHMPAVAAAPGHVQEEIELRRRRNDQRGHGGIVARPRGERKPRASPLIAGRARRSGPRDRAA